MRNDSKEPELDVVEEDILPQQLLDDARRSVSAVTLLPLCLGEDGSPLFAASTSSVRKLLVEGGVSTLVLPSSPSARFRDDRSLEWIPPTLFIGLATYSQNRALVDVSLNLISSYAYDLFLGIGRDPSIRLDVVCERGDGRSIRRVKYRGPAKGLDKVSKIIGEIMDDPNG